MNNLSPNALDSFLKLIKIKVDQVDYQDISDQSLEKLKIKAANLKLQTHCSFF